MIHFIATRDHAFTLQHYLETWGRDLRPMLRSVHYEDLALAPDLSPGTYLFTDLERLDDAQLALATEVWRQLAARPESFRLFNDPAKVLRRYELLSALHAAGINRFAAYRIADLNNVAWASCPSDRGGQPLPAAALERSGETPKPLSKPPSYPMFIRHEREHDGPLSALLHCREEVDHAVAELKSTDDLLAVELLDTADESGVYRKFSAFRIGERIIARHLFHADSWLVKYADKNPKDDHVAEELAFVRGNPHAAELRKVFDLAHVEYGRVDYGLHEGRIQIWEINTNPSILLPPGRVAPTRLLAQGLFNQQFEEAIRAIDHSPSDTEALHLDLDRSLTQHLQRAIRVLKRKKR